MICTAPPAHIARSAIAPRRGPARIDIVVRTGRPVASFIPRDALGAALDGCDRGDTDTIYTPQNVAAMLSAGCGAIAYRLRTELAGKVWHWNPRGRWSDPVHRRGYWVSDERPAQPILVSYGYRLPRRGNTIDQASNDGYSRLDDGDLSSFWKSDPYLDRRYTRESNRRHPQWVVIDLGKQAKVDAIRIAWADPYATEYSIDYWRGHDEDFLNDLVDGRWVTFPRGQVGHGRGGTVTIRLATAPVQARYVRIWMTASSGTAPPGSTDVRDRLGFAIREVYLGRFEPAGRFLDILRHGKTRRAQTTTFVSSTDPWHRATDRDGGAEQPGIDRLFASGIARGLPVLLPSGLLYDTPQNMAALLSYVKQRRYAVTRMEMGEEPDGQLVTPEDYAALYVEFAKALHRVDARVQLGGPGLQSAVDKLYTWRDAAGDDSWLKHFIRYLRARGRLRDLAFFSFEWYPFDNVCLPAPPRLAAAPGLLTRVLRRFQSEGVPRTLPWLITEYGYSSYGCREEVDMAGAIFDADAAAQFLAAGGAGAYFYGYEPAILIKEAPQCNSWGNLTLFLADGSRHIRAPVAAYYAERMLTRVWANTPVACEIYPCRVRDGDLAAFVSAYALRFQDGRWSILALNKSNTRGFSARVLFDNQSDGSDARFHGTVMFGQYSPQQYRWHADGLRGFPSRDLPPAYNRRPAAERFELPPYSITVIRGETRSAARSTSRAPLRTHRSPPSYRPGTRERPTRPLALR